MVSNRLSTWIAASVIALAIIVLLTGAASAMTLTKSGKTDYTIVLPDESIASERTAAVELQSYLRQITGAELKILTEHEVKDSAPQILVGQSKRATWVLSGIDWKKLGQDGIVIKTSANKLVLAGGRPRGSIYAVYSFLEDTVGCRWWTSTESTIPHRSTLNIPELNVNYTPKLIVREAFYRDLTGNASFAIKMKANGHSNDISNDYGGHKSILGWCHTSYDLLPPSKYFKDHPDWYALVGGKRVSENAQLCWSNEEMQKEMVKVALEKIKKEPEAGIISISQMDWLGMCECPKCKAIQDANGGVYSAPIIEAINAIATEIEKTYPDVLVETLAYQFSQTPPTNVKPRKNVLIRLCPINANAVQNFDSEDNKIFRDDINKWAQIAPNLYIWTYVTNFGNYLTPHPNIRTLAPNIRFLVTKNVVGMFEQGDVECSVGDFVRYRAWLICHLMWNPDLDEKKLTKEFMDGYYGAAGRYMEACIDVLNNTEGLKSGGFGCIYDNTAWLSFADLTKATELVNKAEKAVANDPILLARVQRDRMPLDIVWLLRYEELKAKADTDKVAFLGPKDPYAAAKEYCRKAEAWDVGSYAYITKFDSYGKGLLSRFAAPALSLEELDKLPKEDTVTIQQDQFNLAGPGDWTKIIDDPKASDGKAVMMPETHRQWATQCHFKEDFVSAHPGKWTIYLIARTEGAKSGPAFQLGIFDPSAGQYAANMGVDLSRTAGDTYRTISLGTHELKSGWYVFAAPSGDPNQVKGIYIDRIVLVRSK